MSVDGNQDGFLSVLFTPNIEFFGQHLIELLTAKSFNFNDCFRLVLVRKALDLNMFYLRELISHVIVQVDSIVDKIFTLVYHLSNSGFYVSQKEKRRT